ncbi:hypothetical protein J6590_041893 [Homalodisca vitripennis]|nr:hypothetical protein J6590_041893 [Homalodisca vitripennis]
MEIGDTNNLRQSVRPNLVQTVQYSQAATLQNNQKQYRLGGVKSNSGSGPTVNPPTRNIQREAVPVCWNCEETGHRFICFPKGRQTVVTACDPMLEAVNEAIDSNYEETESSVTFSYPHANEIKTAVTTSNTIEFLSCHKMDELKKESGPTPNTSYQDVNMQKEASAEDEFEMLNECDVTFSRASSPCLSIMEDSEWVDKELGKDFQETSPKTNVNSSTNYITTIQGAPQRMQPPQPEKTETPEEINKHVLDCSLNIRNVQAASNKPKRYRPKRGRVFNPDGTFVRIDVRKLPPELR